MMDFDIGVLGMYVTQHYGRLAAGLCLFLPLSALAAPLPPKAGQSIRELETAPPAPPPVDSTVLPVPAPASTSAQPAPQGPTLTVQQFTVSGNQTISSEVLLAAVSDLTAKPLTLAELQGAAERITNIYRREGWLLARAMIPAQEVSAGVVNIQVLEGRYGEVTINNSSRVSDGVVKNFTKNLRSGDGVQAAPLERSLLLLNDLPGVKVGSSLAAGKDVGSSDLAIELKPGPQYEGGLSIDNYGNSYNGAWRLNADLDINNPLQAGDRLSLRALVSDEAQHYLRGQYELPVGPWATRAGAAYSWMDYELGKDFEVLEST
ncbi:MAG: POTRA domain-containing protein, partial [Pedobacter sp.]|nr:POTRA domain-containing protein [Pedobacter sp.]